MHGWLPSSLTPTSPVSPPSVETAVSSNDASVRLSSSASIFLCSVRALLHHLSFWGPLAFISLPLIQLLPWDSAICLHSAGWLPLCYLYILEIFVGPQLLSAISPLHILFSVAYWSFFSLFFSQLFFGHQSRVEPSQVSRLSLPLGKKKKFDGCCFKILFFMSAQTAAWERGGVTKKYTVYVLYIYKNCIPCFFPVTIHFHMWRRKGGSTVAFEKCPHFFFFCSICILDPYCKSLRICISYAN